MASTAFRRPIKGLAASLLDGSGPATEADTAQGLRQQCSDAAAALWQRLRLAWWWKAPRIFAGQAVAVGHSPRHRRNPCLTFGQDEMTLWPSSRESSQQTTQEMTCLASALAKPARMPHLMFSPSVLHRADHWPGLLG